MYQNVNDILRITNQINKRNQVLRDQAEIDRDNYAQKMYMKHNLPVPIKPNYMVERNYIPEFQASNIPEYQIEQKEYAMIREAVSEEKNAQITPLVQKPVNPVYGAKLMQSVNDLKTELNAFFTSRGITKPDLLFKINKSFNNLSVAYQEDTNSINGDRLFRTQFIYVLSNIETLLTNLQGKLEYYQRTKNHIDTKELIENLDDYELQQFIDKTKIMKDIVDQMINGRSITGFSNDVINSLVNYTPDQYNETGLPPLPTSTTVPPVVPPVVPPASGVGTSADGSDAPPPPTDAFGTPAPDSTSRPEAITMLASSIEPQVLKYASITGRLRDSKRDGEKRALRSQQTTIINAVHQIFVNAEIPNIIATPTKKDIADVLNNHKQAPAQKVNALMVLSTPERTARPTHGDVGVVDYPTIDEYPGMLARDYDDAKARLATQLRTHVTEFTNEWNGRKTDSILGDAYSSIMETIGGMAELSQTHGRAFHAIPRRELTDGELRSILEAHDTVDDKIDNILEEMSKSPPAVAPTHDAPAGDDETKDESTGTLAVVPPTSTFDEQVDAEVTKIKPKYRAQVKAMYMKLKILSAKKNFNADCTAEVQKVLNDIYIDVNGKEFNDTFTELNSGDWVSNSKDPKKGAFKQMKAGKLLPIITKYYIDRTASRIIVDNRRTSGKPNQERKIGLENMSTALFG
jgi:hypothetical protein